MNKFVNEAGIFNTCNDNRGTGIALEGGNSTENSFFQNTCNNNYYGIGIWFSRNIIVDGNHLSNNTNGILISSSRNIDVRNNDLFHNGFYIYGDNLREWDSLSIDISNTINGKSIYFLKNQTGGKIPPDSGQVILVNCTDFLIENLSRSNSTSGITLAYSNNNRNSST